MLAVFMPMIRTFVYAVELMVVTELIGSLSITRSIFMKNI